MLAASILTVTTPINRLFLPLHIWIMIKYGNDIMKNLEKNPQVSFQTGSCGRIFFFVSPADIKQGSRNFRAKNRSVRINPFFRSEFPGAQPVVSPLKSLPILLEIFQVRKLIHSEDKKENRTEDK